MTKTNRIVMEMRNVSYIEKPKAFLKFERNGFSVSEIQVTRVDASHYDMVAIKYQQTKTLFDWR